MINIFHRSREFVEKHKQHHHFVLAVLALVIAGTGVYTWRHEIAQAATYTFTQTSWAGGVSANTETHTAFFDPLQDNQIWTKYSATSSAILASAGGVSLPPVAHSFTDDGTISDIVVRTPIATGGTITYSGNYEIHTFTSSSTFQVTSGSGANVDYLIVGGGGHGGRCNVSGCSITMAGGGGAGGFLASSTHAVTNQPYTVTVGAGAAAFNASGDNSVFDGITAYGGGPGGNSGAAPYPGTGGGSGGGGGKDGTVLVAGGNGTAGQGNAGGSGVLLGSSAGGGGGGGAGANGTNGTANGTNGAGGAGGVGLTSAIAQLTTCPAGGTAPNCYYAGGGGGGYWVGTINGAGGLGGGGTAGTSAVAAGIGGTGGGGGATNSAGGGGAGGSGVVIIRLLNPVSSPTGGTFGAGATSSTVVSGTGTSTSVGLGRTFWATRAAVPAATSFGAALVGAKGYIYGFKGGLSTAFYQYASSTDTWSTLTPAPATIYSGGSLVYPGSGDLIYAFRGNSSATFYSYSISGNSWSTLTAAPGIVTSGASLVYPGSGDFIYAFAGNTTTVFYRYSISANTWSTMTAAPGSISMGGSLVYPSSGDFIYGYRGGGNTTFYRYSILNNTWATMAPAPGAINQIYGGNALVYPGSGDYFYGYSGNGSTALYRYSISTDTWASMTASPIGIYVTAALAYPGTGNYIYGYQGNSTTDFARYDITPSYNTPGTFTSAVINLGGLVKSSPAPTLSWATGGTGTITMEVSTSADNTTWTGYSAITTGGAITVPAAGVKYVQYRATLTAPDPAFTPTLNDVTIGYTQYALTGDLTSSKYDTNDSSNTFSGITWDASPVDASSTVSFQVRTASTSVLLDSAAWCGPASCSGSNFFTTSGQSISNTTLTDHVNDEFIQYKAFITSGGDITPVLTSVTMTYVVNAPPVVSNVTATQGSNGIVSISYGASDYDTEQGSLTPVNNRNKVTPTQYEYSTNGGGAWTTISSSELDNGAFSIINIDNNTSTTTVYATWTPQAGIAWTNNAKIKVTLTDGEGANFLGTGIQATPFTLDTAPPVVTSASFDSTQDLVSLTATDGSAMEYRLCNSACVSETWRTIINNTSTSTSWSPTGFGAGAETVYLQVRDLYGNVNTTPTSIVAPATPSERFLAADVSNPSANTFGETLSWVAVSNATTYDVYYATTTSASVTPSTYTSLVSQAGNTFPHIISPSASSSAYWYKVRAVTSTATGNNISNWASITPGDVPDSFGISLGDTDPPNITAWATSSVLSTSAIVTITTNEIASGRVYYGTGISNGTNCDSYTSSTPPSVLYSTSTSITLTGLTPSTTYFFCMKAKDPTGNPTGNPTTGTDGGSFTTATGPTISSVTVQNLAGTSATIMWDTATSSNSYIHYSTSNSLVNPTVVGNATMVAESATPGIFQHQVGLSGLTAATDYYFKVQSTDGDGNSITNTNGGSYFHFRTNEDTTAPALVGDITTPVKSSTAVVIVWQTDEPASSQVNWGNASTSLLRFTVNDTTKSIYHVVTLSSGTLDTTALSQELVAETTYYFTVKSSDAANNPMTSAVQSFTTAVDGAATITYVYIRAAGDAKDTTPPSISNVVVSDITPFSAVVKFSTDEDTVAGVDAGATQTYGQTASSFDWGKTQTIKLRGLTLGTEYHIRVKAVDKAGNTGTSADQTFKTTFLSENLKDMANVENIEQFQKEIENAIESILPSLVPPFITKPIISDITEGGAKVSFKSNIKAFPVVVFAEDGAYDETKENPYTGEVSDTAEKATSHELLLTGLKGNTKYHIQARAFSLPKVLGKSADVTFITKASKIAGSIVERKKDSFTVVWTTDQPTTSIVEFKDLKRGVTERKTDDAKKTSHSMKIENLPSGTAYEVNLSGLTEQGNIAEAGSPLSVTTSTDTIAPSISGFKVDNALVPGRTDRIQTIVSWVTDEPGNSTVYYEEGAGTPGDTKELTNKNESLDSYTANHSTILPNLKPGTIYRLKVTSSDDSGNLGSFGPRTVITPKQTESITDIIFKNFEDSFKFMRKI